MTPPAPVTPTVATQPSQPPHAPVTVVSTFQSRKRAVNEEEIDLTGALGELQASAPAASESLDAVFEGLRDDASRTLRR